MGFFSGGEHLSGRKSMNWLGCLLAVVMTIIYAVYVADTIWGFIPTGSWLLTFIPQAMLYGPMIIVIIVGMSAVEFAPLTVRVLYLAVWVAIILCSFFPEVIGLA